jgi:hypothetical protein
MGGGGPSSTTSTTTNVTAPPAYVQGQAVELLNRASDLSNRPYDPALSQKVAPLTAAHQAGMNLVTNRAANGSPILNAGNAQATNTLQGAYMGPAAKNSMAGVNNPYLQKVINSTNQDITRSFLNSTMPQTDASMARAGAFGGSAWQQANAENNRQMASELAKNTSNLRYQDYLGQQGLAESQAQRDQSAFDSERQRQVGSLGAAQTFANQPYTDAMQLLGVGDIQRTQEQDFLNAQYQNLLNQQNWPLQNLDILQNAIRTSMGNGGSSVQSAQLPKVSSTSGMIGGGLAGMQLGGALGNSLYGAGSTGANVGAGLGAAGGALAGLFG